MGFCSDFWAGSVSTQVSCEDGGVHQDVRGLSVDALIWHSVDRDGVNNMLRSFWIGELEWDCKREIKAWEGDKVEPEDRKEWLEDDIHGASDLVTQVSVIPAEVDVIRLFIVELSKRRLSGTISLLRVLAIRILGFSFSFFL